jgi:uncharacterized SAM-binding protein YcdF (DUF218 family)
MRNLLVPLAMPPIGLVLLIVTGLLLGHRRSRQSWFRLGRILSWTGVVTLLLMGLPILSGNALVALESGYSTMPDAEHPPQAIIVLSAEEIRSHQEPLGARPGLMTLDRLRAAAALQRQTGLPILVSGGTTQFDVTPLAEVMARSLQQDFRVPVRWVEARSLDTWQNARFSADILRPEGISSVYLVTHAWHMRRAVLAFEGTGLRVPAAPTTRDDPPSLEIHNFLPRTGGWDTGFLALHEWIGYAFYRLR